MAIDKPLGGLLNQDDFEMGPEGLLVAEEETPVGDSMLTELEDGGVEIDFDPMSSLMGGGEEPFDSNLAEYIEDNELRTLAIDCISMFDSDKSSRSDWETTYEEGLDQLGLGIEDRTTPWAGACGVFHPMLSEAVVRFQAQTIQEIMPAKGPVKTHIWGVVTDEREKQAQRVQDYMNYQLIEVMTEYRSETEKLLFSLPLAGSAFRKIYFDPSLGRPTSMFVPAEDFVVSYPITSKFNEIGGVSPSWDNNERHQLLEMHCDIDVPGFEDPDGVALPYVITIDKSSSTILSIYRNWSEDDPHRIKKQHFVHYGYVPGIGFYNLGLIHMIGGLAKSATSLLRQLVDAGTLSNLPGGLKTRGLRIKGDDTPIMPGEFRDVDVPGGVIRDNITFLPYKEPSSVLYQLLGNIVEEGRRFASMADLKVADMNQEAPVGTTLAIMERAMKVQSAIQARIHASLKQEYKILAGVIRDYTSPDYPYETEEGEDIKLEDFDDRIDVVPVSDPNASTMAQRIMQYQAAMQLAQQSPGLYDMPLLHREMMELIGIPNVDKIVPKPDEARPTDPVSENEDVLTLKPVKAFEYQDHEAHMRVHMVLKNDPQIKEQMQNNKMGSAINSALDAHIREHLAFIFRDQIEEELGVPLPPTNQPLPQDVEKRLSALVADAADQMLGKKKAKAKAEKDAKMQKDPIVQQREKELDIRREDVQRRAQADQAKSQLEQQKLTVTQQAGQEKQQLEREKIASKERSDAAALEQEREEMLLKSQIDQEQFDVEQETEGVKASLAREKFDAEQEMEGVKLELEQQKFDAEQEAEGVKFGLKMSENDKNE